MSLFLVTVLMLNACIEIQQPTVKFGNYEVSEINLEKIKIDFIFSIHNPNPIGLENAFYNFKLEVNNKSVVQSQDTQFSLAAGKTSKLKLPIELTYANIFNTSTAFKNSISRGQNSIPYKITGQFKLNFIAFPFTIPFSHEGTIPLPKLPEVSIDALFGEASKIIQ